MYDIHINVTSIIITFLKIKKWYYKKIKYKFGTEFFHLSQIGILYFFCLRLVLEHFFRQINRYPSLTSLSSRHMIEYMWYKWCHDDVWHQTWPCGYSTSLCSQGHMTVSLGCVTQCARVKQILHLKINIHTIVWQPVSHVTPLTHIGTGL